VAADIADSEDFIAYTGNANGFAILLDSHRLTSLKR
jgi:hypothetical protein